MEKILIALGVIGGIVIAGYFIFQRADLDSEPTPAPQVEATPTNFPDRVPTSTPAPTVAPTPAPTVAPTPTPTVQPTPEPTQEAQEPTVRQFTLSADDDGYSPSGALTVSVGDTVNITFNVKTTNVAFGGLDFRGGPVDSGAIAPGGSKTVSFTADSSFSIRAFWPSSNTMKSYTIPVQVN